MKKIFVILCILIITALCIVIAWRTLFLGTYELCLHSRLMITGHYNSGFSSGYLKSEEDLNGFMSTIGSTSHVPSIDYARYMWIYSPYEIEKIYHSFGAGMIFIKPTKTPQDGLSIYMVCVRRREAAGPKPMSPAQ